MQDTESPSPIREESEIKTPQDPLNELSDMLLRAARTPEEKIIAKMNIHDLDSRRNSLLSFLRNYEVQGGNLRGEVYDMNHSLAGIPELRYINPISASLPVFSIVDSAGYMSLDYTKRFLQELGVAGKEQSEKGQALFEFFQKCLNLPRYDLSVPNQAIPDHPIQAVKNSGGRSPRPAHQWAAQLPTKIDGVTAMINMMSPYDVNISISPKAISRINPPRIIDR